MFEKVLSSLLSNVKESFNFLLGFMILVAKYLHYLICDVLRDFLRFHFVSGAPLMPDEEDEIVMKYSGLLGSHVDIQVSLCFVISEST